MIKKEKQVNTDLNKKKRGRPSKASMGNSQVRPKAPDFGSGIAGSNPASPTNKTDKIAPKEWSIKTEDTWGKWKIQKVSETSQIFLDWIKDCEKIVLDGWKLIFKNQKHCLYVIMKKDKEERPFAHIEKSTGNIHCPGGDFPLSYSRGNITDPETRLMDITPYGVKAHWTFLPTHPEYKKASIYCIPEVELIDC